VTVPCPPGIGPPRDPDEYWKRPLADGREIWLDAWLVSTRVELSFRQIRSETRRMSPAGAVPQMCQQVDVRQPTRREIRAYSCYQYELKEAKGWAFWVGGTLFAAGTIAFVVGTAGWGIPALGAGAAALAGFGGGATTLGGGVVAFFPSPRQVRGKFIGHVTYDRANEWTDDGAANEVAVGAPFPCP
jgi:hypothetical protein